MNCEGLLRGRGPNRVVPSGCAGGHGDDRRVRHNSFFLTPIIIGNHHPLNHATEEPWLSILMDFSEF